MRKYPVGLDTDTKGSDVSFLTLPLNWEVTGRARSLGLVTEMDYFLLRNAREWEHPVNRGSYFARPKHVQLTSSGSFSAFLPIPHYSFLNSIVFPSSSDECNVRNASVAVVAFFYVINKRIATNPRIGLLTLNTLRIFGLRYLGITKISSPSFGLKYLRADSLSDPSKDVD